MLKRIGVYFIISLFSVTAIATAYPQPASAVVAKRLYNNSAYAVWVYDARGYKYNIPAYSNSSYITNGVGSFEARYGMCGNYHFSGESYSRSFRYGYKYYISSSTVYIDAQRYCN